MATVTVRQLKNKDTGIDITVPTYEEIPGLLTKTIEFQVTVVTNLAVFKLPKHKETDVVQFVVGKKFSDFEDLYLLLNEKFSGIAFPPLPKKVLITTDEVNRERRAALDSLLKFFSKTPRVSTCPLLLEFLGASPSQVQRIDSLIIKDKSDDSIDSGLSPSKDFVDDKKSPSDESDIFGENEDDIHDLFSDMKAKTFFERRNTESDLFEDSPEHKSYDVKLFEEQDYSEAISKEDQLFFEKEAAKTKMKLNTKSSFDTDGLLNVEDDLDQLLKITKRSKRAPKISKSAHGTDERPKSSISLSSPDKFDLPTSADDFMKYIEENSSRDEVDLFS